jgi:hypothetical protein
MAFSHMPPVRMRLQLISVTSSLRWLQTRVRYHRGKRLTYRYEMLLSDH